MADTKGDVLLGEFISGTEAFSVTLDDNQISWIPSIPRFVSVTGSTSVKWSLTAIPNHMLTVPNSLAY